MRKRLTEDLRVKIIKMANDGYVMREIAERYGVCLKTVDKVMSECGGIKSIRAAVTALESPWVNQ